MLVERLRAANGEFGTVDAVIFHAVSYTFKMET